MTIYYFCRDDNAPSGGRRVLYQQVDILNAAGVDAAIIHATPGFRLTWFENKTRVISVQDVHNQDGDVFAIPETMARGAIDSLPAELPKVIICQNAYYSFAGHGLYNDNPHAFYHPSVIALQCVSDDNCQALEWMFPGVPVKRVIVGIDPERFGYVEDKKQVIAFMPRKGGEDALSVLNALRNRDALKGWTILPLEGIRHDLVARALGRAAIYLSTGYPEGQPLPPLEAIARGCVVVGYDGFGGHEYDFPAFFHTPNADILTLARALEWLAAGAWKDFDRRGSSAAALDRYSLDRQAETVLEFWQWAAELSRAEVATC